MATFKCKMCGGDIQAEINAAFGTCDSCGVTSTLPKANDDKLVNLFNRANHFRRLNEFDKAIAIYENILNEDAANAEAHWCVVLCRYGIEYVEDPKTYQRIPTCHRTQFASILTDADYLAALENASDSYIKGLYEAEANKINEIQKGILAISSQEQPYDIFICYKETTDGGSRTKDSTIAQDIYYQLADAYKVFFAKITLEDKLGQEYEPYIFNALNSAKVMLVLGTKKEHFEAVWVKNEWSRFLALAKNDRSRLLIPCYRDMDAYDIPDELSHFQALDMGKIGFAQDLVRGVNKVLAVESQSPRKSISEDDLYAENDLLDEEELARVKRGFILLEDEEWKKAAECFEYAAERGYVPAYLGLIAARFGRSLVSVKQLMAGNPQFISDTDDIAQVIRFESMYLAQMHLILGEWENADHRYEAVLKKDPEYGQAYLGKLKAEIGIIEIDDLANARRFNRRPADHKNYKNALRFSTQEQREQLEKHDQAIAEYLTTQNESLAQISDDKDKYSFQMIIDGIHTIQGRGAVVNGTINSGMLGIRKKVVGVGAELVGKTGEPKQVSITEVQLPNKSDATFATEGDKTYALLDGVAEEEVAVGQILRGLPLSKYLFYMPIEQISVGGIVSGLVEIGSIRKNDKVEIVGEGRTPLISSVKGIEISKEKVDSASKGDAVFVLLEGVGNGDIATKQILCIMAPTPEELQKAAEIVKPKILRDKENLKQYQIHEDWRSKYLCGFCGGKPSFTGKCKQCNKDGVGGWDNYEKYERIKELDLGMALVQRHRDWSEKGLCNYCGSPVAFALVSDKCTKCGKKKRDYAEMEAEIIKKYDVRYDLGFRAEDYHIHSNILTNTDSGEE